ncbi:MAG: DUF1294 domain-containing protein [Bacillota bacterium]|nr:DUF1294 domain-containing protein [Bacillota bacterium]
MKEFLWFYLIMNIYGLFLMWTDKKRAIHHQYRIRERTLWLVALFGGAVGTTIGMQMFRHKTKHINFKIGFPLLAILDIFLVFYMLVK